MSVMDEQYHVHDLLAAYVLGAVTPEEAALVEEHLATCALCRGQESEFREVERGLPLLAGELAPPPALKARLMSIVEAEAATREDTAAQDTAAPASRPNGARSGSRLSVVPPGEHAARTLPAPPATRWRGRPLGPILAIAAALVLVALGLGLWRAIGGTTQPTHTYALYGAGPGKPFLGTLSYYQDGKRLALDLHGLKKTPARRVYELWLIRKRGGKPVGLAGVGVFPSPDGTGRRTFTGHDVPSYTLAALTIERKLVPAPTTKIVADATI